MSLYTTSGRLRWRHVQSGWMLSLCALAALAAISVLGLVLFFLAQRGAPHLSLKLLTKLPDQGGVAHSILGTLSLLAIASLLSIPLGVLGGIYQREAQGKLAAVVRFLTDVLNGIPSIVIGIFVYAALVYPLSQANPGKGYSGYAGGIALGIMMVPLVMRTTEEMLRLVPNALREASLGLGASRWRTMLSVILPAARGGILTGILLAIARVSGETAPLIFTVLGNEFLPTRTWRGVTLPILDGPIDALPLRLFRYASSADEEQNNIAWAAALVLILIVLLMSVAARLATRGRVQEDK